MTRTIEAIMRHMAAPSNHVPHQTNGTKKLEKDVTVQKRQRYVWSEARFVRTIARFRCEVRVALNGKEVDGRNVLELITLDPPEGATVRIRAEGPDAAAYRGQDKKFSLSFYYDSRTVHFGLLAVPTKGPTRPSLITMI
jgi:phosphotransferase system HPr (HPr) family protein